MFYLIRQSIPLLCRFWAVLLNYLLNTVLTLGMLECLNVADPLFFVYREVKKLEVGWNKMINDVMS